MTDPQRYCPRTDAAAKPLFLPVSVVSVLSVVMVWISVLLALGTLTAPLFANQIEGVRFGQQGGATRIVIDLESATKPSVFLLADPFRVVVDIEDANWTAARDASATGVVSGYRHGNFRRGTYRLVFDLKSPAVVDKSFALPPNARSGHRYVIDLKGASRANFLRAVQASRPARPRQPISDSVPVLSTQPRRANQKPLVVIDAGHGGVDPGTLGVLGVNEKIVNLGVAKALQSELQRGGKYRVRLTRETDIFIPVRDRFKIARKWGADLFISIHADAIADRSVRGGTVYTLSEEASDKEAARLAARENKSDIIAGVDLGLADDDVSNILIDLAQRETMNVSAQFAEMLVPEMRREVLMHKKGHRFANLGVLKAPDVPSVLIETGYLSNRSDARLLASREGQRKLARSISRGVEKYFKAQSALGR